ncbi:hypothetical protein VTO73DRAFT_3584 [Trametes versicolor]
MPSAFDILGLVLGIVSVSELFKIALRFLANRLPSGRQGKLEKALVKIDVQLCRLERSDSFNEGGAERKEVNELAKRLGGLSQDVEEWEERGITRYLDYRAAIKLLRRCCELEKSATRLRTRLRREAQKLDIESPVPLADMDRHIANADLAPHLEATSHLVTTSHAPQEPPLQSSRWLPCNPAPWGPPSPPPSTSPRQANADLRVASGVERSYGTHRVLQPQSWTTWQPNPSFQPTPPSLSEAQELSRRAVAGGRRPRIPSRSQQASAYLVQDVEPSYFTHWDQSWGTWQPNPALQPSPPPDQIESRPVVEPAWGSPGCLDDNRRPEIDQRRYA